MPNTLSVISNAAVAEFRQTAFSVWHNSAISFSNCFVFGPVVIHPDFKASTTSLISSSPTSGGENGIFIFVLISIPSF